MTSTEDFADRMVAKHPKPNTFTADAIEDAGGRLVTEAEITKQYDGAILATKKVQWTVRVTSAAAVANTGSYRFTADFIANKDSLSVRDVTVRVDAPTQWDRGRVLKRLLEKLGTRALAARTTVIPRSSARRRRAVALIPAPAPQQLSRDAILSADRRASTARVGRQPFGCHIDRLPFFCTHHCVY